MTMSATGRKFKNVEGVRFGRLVVVSYYGRKNGEHSWVCSCDCGGEAIISGRVIKRRRSCGCIRREVGKTANLRHGKSYERIYNIWAMMRQRCENPHHTSYKHYGARGISVCKRWKTSFENFYADMGVPPKNFCLERIDNNGPYSPDNCRWESRREQLNNTRRNVYYEYEGERITAFELARRKGLLPGILSHRLKKGWSIEKALNEPVVENARHRRCDREFLEYNGERLTAHQWSKKIGIDAGSIRSRLRRGWTIDRALTTPVAAR